MRQNLQAFIYFTNIFRVLKKERNAVGTSDGLVGMMMLLAEDQSKSWIANK